MTAAVPPLDAADPRAALGQVFGLAGFRPGQEEVVRAVLAGEDVLAVMPTGAGKSLCYQLPAMLLPGCTVVISPLVALMKDQVDSLPPALRGCAAVFNSALERGELDANAAELAAGRLKLVYVAPERLRQRPFLHALGRAAISRFVVDEAHCISLWGHDFRPDYLFIPDVVRMLGGPPVLAMTATATPALQEELRQRFHRPLRTVHTGVLRPNLFLEVQRVRDAEEKLRLLIELCGAERGAGIVYVSSRERAEQVANVLRRNGVNARHYHAGLDSGERAAVQDGFMGGRVRVIVATVAFGMGVDKQDVRFLVHFNPSRSLEAYAQESGRAGRDGRPARCTLFWAGSDQASLNRWVKEDALSPALLRAVYRAVRQGANGRFAWWPAERLARAAQDAGTGEIDETMVRVAVGALEQAGVLRRHCDLPETARVRARAGQPSSPMADVSAALDLSPGERLSIEMFEVAAALGCSPSEVEERLLAAQESGAIAYQGLGRGMLLELLPHPPDLAQRLRGLLDGYRRAQLERVEEMKSYATRRLCRTATIARHFGVAHAGRCGHCDVCQGRGDGRGTRREDTAAAGGRTASAGRTQEAPVQPERAPEDIIIACVAELPFPMGRTGVTNVLKGSVKSAVQADRSRHFGVLAALTVAAIEREVERLVEGGYLARDEGEYRLLSVTPEGFAKEPAPWPPARSSLSETRSRDGGRFGGPTPSVSRRIEVEAPDLPAFAEDDPQVEERFERLRAWRRERSREQNVSAFVVFGDATLRLLAAHHVSSLDDLGRIKGVGPAKLERYGEALLDLLRDADLA